MRALAPLLLLLGTAAVASLGPFSGRAASAPARVLSAPRRHAGPRPHAVATAIVLATLLSGVRRRRPSEPDDSSDPPDDDLDA